jgi:hypothetical protein
MSGSGVRQTAGTWFVALVTLGVLVALCAVGIRSCMADRASAARLARARTRLAKSVTATCLNCRNGMHVGADVEVDGKQYDCGADRVFTDDWPWSRSKDRYCPCPGHGWGRGCLNETCPVQMPVLYDPANPSNCRAVDNDDSVGVFAQACDRGEALDCWALGYLYERGETVGEDALKAAGLYRRACDGGDAHGCWALGNLNEQGNGVQKDEVAAAGLYKRACDGGDAVGCGALGDVLAKRNDPRAAPLYEQACNAGNLFSCGDLGLMYEKGTGVAPDHVKAAGLYRRLCKGTNLHAGWACGRAGQLRRTEGITDP